MYWLVRWLARIGYSARGAVYLLFGALALRTAIILSAAHDVRGSLRVVNDYPGRRALLLFMAAGLLAYAVWRGVQAIGDTDSHGWRLQALCVRGGLLATASRSATSWPPFWPGRGGELVVFAGLFALGAGIAHIHKGVKGRFRRWFVASPATLAWVDPISRVGLRARGCCFLGAAGSWWYRA